jgi:RNase P subunit RPR2
MVQIVGNDPQAVKRTTCRNCAAVLEYTPSEVKEYHGKDYSGGSDGKEWIDCPRCGTQVVLRSW